MNTNYEYKKSDTECPVCGIKSFSHSHPANSKPRDFVMTEEVTSPHQPYCQCPQCEPSSPLTMEEKLTEIVFRNWKNSDEVGLHTEIKDLLAAAEQRGKKEAAQEILALTEHPEGWCIKQLDGYDIKKYQQSLSDLT